MSISAVIFDMDGVLIDSGPAHLQSWHLLARELGAAVSDEQFAEQFGKPSRDIIRSLFGSELSDETVRAYDDRKERAFRELVRGRMPAMPGAVELIRNLREAGYSLAIGSSGPPENIRLCIDELGCCQMFDTVISGMDVRAGKPHPEVFLLAGERLGVDPANCLVIEDAPAGIEAARRAKMKCIALVGSHKPASLKSADLVIESLSEVTTELIREL